MNIKAIFGKDKRTALMRKNIIFSFLLKGWSGLVFLLIVPITLKCLGEYKNGIWLTISSMLIWLDNMDIGLGNGLRNKLATFLAHGDIKNARKAVSSTFFMLILIIIPAIILLLTIINYCDLYSFLNVDASKITDLKNVISVSVIFVCATFIFKFIGNFYLGLQLPAVNNFLITCGHTLSLIGTFLAYLSGSHSLILIAVINTGSPLIVYLIAYPSTFLGKYKELRPSAKFFQASMVKELFSIGIKFFLLQISAAIMFLSSNILISRLYNPALVTPYQIAYRYFSVILILFTVLCAPLWTATTDAYERKDIAWIRSTENHMNKILMLIGICILIMIAISKYVYIIWIGKDVTIPLDVTVFMGIYIGIIIYSMAYCYFLNGIGMLALQLICTIGGAIAFIPVTFFLAKHIPGIVSIIISMCIVNLPSLICNKIQFEKILRGTARGIWAKH